MKDLLRKTIQEKPRSWQQIFSQILWAYNTSKRTNTSTSPFTLTYGHDAILLMEIIIPSIRTTFQEKLIVEEFNEAMILELENVDEVRLKALDIMKANKQKISKAYDTKAKKKILQGRRTSVENNSSTRH